MKVELKPPLPAFSGGELNVIVATPFEPTDRDWGRPLLADPPLKVTRPVGTGCPVTCGTVNVSVIGKSESLAQDASDGLGDAVRALDELPGWTFCVTVLEVPPAKFESPGYVDAIW